MLWDRLVAVRALILVSTVWCSRRCCVERGRRGCAHHPLGVLYSIEGDVGKSWLKDYMVKTHEALVVAVDKPTDVKHLILTAMKGKNNNKF